MNDGKNKKCKHRAKRGGKLSRDFFLPHEK
jgi:hypothetical protein